MAAVQIFELEDKLTLFSGMSSKDV